MSYLDGTRTSSGGYITTNGKGFDDLKVTGDLTVGVVKKPGTSLHLPTSVGVGVAKLTALNTACALQVDSATGTKVLGCPVNPSGVTLVSTGVPDGAIVYDDTDSKLKVRASGAWVALH